jgi:hypothetical protein
VRDNIGWDRVKEDLETEQRSLAEGSGQDYRALQQAARQGAAGVPAEFLALEDNKTQVTQKIGETALNVRSRMLEAYRILAFPRGGTADVDNLFAVGGTGSMLECFRVDFGETADPATRRRQSARAAVAEGPILQCLRQYNKLVRDADANDPMVLDPCWPVIGPAAATAPRSSAGRAMRVIRRASDARQSPGGARAQRHPQRPGPR